MTSVTFPPVTPVNHTLCWPPAREMTGRGIYGPAVTGSMVRWMMTTAEWFIPQLCGAMPSCDLRRISVYSSALSSIKKEKKPSCWGQNHVRPCRVRIITFKRGGITKWPRFGCTLEIHKKRTGRGAAGGGTGGGAGTHGRKRQQRTERDFETRRCVINKATQTERLLCVFCLERSSRKGAQLYY